MTYNFLSTGLLHALLKLFLGNFFDVIINGIFLSDSSLLVYKNATAFWIFIVYHATLLNSAFNIGCLSRKVRLLLI